MKVIYPPAKKEHLCTCPCHGPEGARGVHIMPCCDTCDCGANIRFGCFHEHQNACKPKKDRHKDRASE